MCVIRNGNGQSHCECRVKKKACTNCLSTTCSNLKTSGTDAKRALPEDKLKELSGLVALLEYELSQEKVKNTSLLQERAKMKEEHREKDMEMKVEIEKLKKASQIPRNSARQTKEVALDAQKREF